MTAYTTDDILSVGATNIGSLSRGLCSMYETDVAKVTFYKIKNIPSAVAEPLLHGNASVEVLGAVNDLETIVHGSTGPLSGNLVRWTAPNAYDFKNVFIAKAGGIQNCLWGDVDVIVAPDNPTKSSGAGAVLLSEEVQSFCYEHKITNHLQLALRLIKETFIHVRNIEVVIEADPEFDGEWIVINIQVDGDIEHLLDMYDSYTRRFVELVPWPARDKIRLNYDLA